MLHFQCFHQSFSQILICLILFFFSTQVIAITEQISIKKATLSRLENQNNRYEVNIYFEYHLNNYLRDALKNGVTLKSEVIFYLGKQRKWWWNLSKQFTKTEMTLKYHALSQHYQLIRLSTNEYWNFPSLASALDKMGIFNHFLLPILPDEVIQNKSEYYIFAKANLMPTSLKLPLRIQSFFDKKYKLKSQGVVWRIP